MNEWMNECMNECMYGVLGHVLCTYRLNWARKNSKRFNRDMSLKLKEGKNPRIKCDWPDPSYSPPILFCLETCTKINYKKHTQKNSNCGLTHSLTSEFFSDFWIISTWQDPLTSTYVNHWGTQSNLSISTHTTRHQGTDTVTMKICKPLMIFWKKTDATNYTRYFDPPQQTYVHEACLSQCCC